MRLIFVFEAWRTKKPKVWQDETNPLYGIQKKTLNMAGHSLLENYGTLLATRDTKLPGNMAQRQL